MKKIVYYCPKCDSEDIRIESPEPKQRKYSMDGMGSSLLQAKIALSNTVRKNKKAICNNCGYEKEYTE